VLPLRERGRTSQYSSASNMGAQRKISSRNLSALSAVNAWFKSLLSVL
jgi:hypothetical protein